MKFLNSMLELWRASEKKTHTAKLLPRRLLIWHVQVWGLSCFVSVKSW